MRSLLASLLTVLLMGTPVLGHSGPRGSLDGGGGGGNPFALADGAITDESMAILRNSRGPASFDRTGGWTTYYFSSAAGGDLPSGSSSGTGTAVDPMDASLLDNYCISPGVMCVLDSGETFVFPATIRPNSSTCTAYPDEPCIAITTTGSARATITTAGTAATDGPIFALDGATADAGWIVVNNINVVSNQADTDGAGTADNMDAFSVNSGSGTHTKGLFWRTSATVTGDAADNGYTSHGTNPKLVIVDSSCFATATSSGANPCVAPITGSTVLALGLSVTQDSANVAQDAVALSTSTGSGLLTFTWIDGFLEYPDPAAGDSGIELNPDASSTVALTLARVGITMANDTSSCLKTTTSGATAEVATITHYQTTLTGCTDGFVIPSGALDPASRVTFAGVGFTCDGTADNCINLNDPDYDDALTLSLSTWIYDSDDSTDIFHLENGGAASVEDSDTAADFQADLDADGQAFTVSLNNSATNTDDPQVQWSNGTTAFAQLGCQPINDCWRAYDSAYTVTLPFTLPVWMLGGVVSRATLNGTDGNIGR